MDDIQCAGNETEISDCRFEGWGKSDCDASEAAGVVCIDTENSKNSTKIKALAKEAKKTLLNKDNEIELRLTGGRNKREGKVEVGKLLKFSTLTSSNRFI